MKVGDLVTNVADDPDVKYWGIGIIIESAPAPGPLIASQNNDDWFRVLWARLSRYRSWEHPQQLEVISESW